MQVPGQILKIFHVGRHCDILVPARRRGYLITFNQLLWTNLYKKNYNTIALCFQYTLFNYFIYKRSNVTEWSYEYCQYTIFFINRTVERSPEYWTLSSLATIEFYLKNIASLECSIREKIPTLPKNLNRWMYHSFISVIQPTSVKMLTQAFLHHIFSNIFPTQQMYHQQIPMVPT